MPHKQFQTLHAKGVTPTCPEAGGELRNRAIYGLKLARAVNQ